MREKHALNAQIQQIAQRGLGHVTRGQLLALGLSRSFIQSRIEQGRLIPVHAGVYAVGHVPRHAHAHAMAALLACGDDAAISHAASAAMWDAFDWPATLEVSCPGSRVRPGIWTHRTRTLTPHDVRTRHAMRVTSPVRTALDLQARLDDARLIRLVNDLRIAGHLGPTATAELRRRSVRIDGLLGDGRPTRSALEDLFARFVARHRLPMPEVNARLPHSGREVDAIYRAARLIVELDSWRFHQDRRSFETDREKDARALAAGYRTLRITERRLSRGGEAEAATIRNILAGA